MRKLFYLQGTEKEKENFIKQNNLQSYEFSRKNLWNILSYQKVNHDSFELEFQLDDKNFINQIEKSTLFHKMKAGSTIFFNPQNKNCLQKYRNFATNYSYEFVPINVNDFSIKEYSENFLKEHIIEAHNYENIYVIGDVHASYSVLKKFFEKDEDIHKNNLFIFTGDYLDRGIESEEMIRFFLEKYQLENFIFLCGNHETHLIDYFADNHSPYKDFDEITIPAIKKFDTREVKKFLRSLKDFLILQVNGTEYFISHGGNLIKDIHQEILKIPSREFWYGTKGYNFDIDKLSKDYDYGIIHGHRNIFKNDIQNGKFFNLEGRVEYGGDLRILKINVQENKFENLYYKNDVFDENLKPHPMWSIE